MTTFANQGNKKPEPEKSEHRLREDMTDIKRDAGMVKEDLQTLKKDAVHMASHAGHEAMEAMRCGAQSVGEAAKSVGDTATRYQAQLRHNVETRPMTSVLIALGVGVVVGRLLAARR